MAYNFITQATGDARYAQIGQTFGGGGDLASSRPNDESDAGVVGAFARIDHKHDREWVHGTAAERAALAADHLFEGLTFRETDGNDKLYTYRGGAWLQVGETVLCTAATRPSNPYQGMQIYETDTGQELVYYGATTGWRPPWGRPWGYITHATTVANQAGITTVVDITGLTVDVPQVLNRRYKYTINGEVFSTVADGAFIFALTGSDNAQIKRDTGFPETTSSSVEMTFIETAASTATVTRKLRLVRASGTGTYTFGAGTDNPALILVEDIGPSGSAPAS